MGQKPKKTVKDFQEKYQSEPSGVVDSDTIDDLTIELEQKDFESEDLNKIQKKQTKKIEDDGENEKESEGNLKNIIIGDSTVPYLDNGIQKGK